MTVPFRHCVHRDVLGWYALVCRDGLARSLRPHAEPCDAQGLFGSGAVPSGRAVRCTETGWFTDQVEELRAVRRDLKNENVINPKTMLYQWQFHLLKGMLITSILHNRQPGTGNRVIIEHQNHSLNLWNQMKPTGFDLL